MSTSRIALVLLAAGLVSALAGCGALGGDGVPKDFPHAVPLSSGKVVFGAAVGSGSAEVWNVTVKVPGASASGRIARQLESAGLTGRVESTAPDGGGTAAYSGDGYDVVVVVTDAGVNGWVADYTVKREG